VQTREKCNWPNLICAALEIVESGFQVSRRLLQKSTKNCFEIRRNESANLNFKVKPALLQIYGKSVHYLFTRLCRSMSVGQNLSTKTCRTMIGCPPPQKKMSDVFVQFLCAHIFPLTFQSLAHRRFPPFCPIWTQKHSWKNILFVETVSFWDSFPFLCSFFSVVCLISDRLFSLDALCSFSLLPVFVFPSCFLSSFPFFLRRYVFIYIDWLLGRVTRLGDFSPIRRSFTLGSFLIA
jgi:hypothetical protein